ncbi:C40 family peptidase [Streptomyces sp. TP-A0356]|uniref:C40 family peptidase n=1 Tax=Streptomyces sp. TP-A0356 TaxID=1359208 RepID=UPI0006E20DC2|nr:C40 family peptidase [Streptomyces sp. TP-A0356]
MAPDGPSRDEVQQRIHSLYDQAETATGNYNATRAMATGSRKRVTPVFRAERRPADPALDDVVRQWFDAARTKLGPTVPAVLPADRTPNTPAGARPTGPAGRPGGDLTGRGRGTSDRAVLELTAGAGTGPLAELTAGAGTGPLAELTARPLAALPAAPEPRQEARSALPGPPTEPRQTAVATSKEHNQRKLAAARELLAQRTAQRGTPLAAIESRPTAGAWRVPEEQVRREGGEPWQQQPALSIDMPDLPVTLGAPVASLSSVSSVAPAAPLAPAASLAPAAPLVPPASSTADVFVGADALVDSRAFVAPDALTAIGGAPESGYDRKAAKALDFVRAQIGRPCLWGATGPDSYDASGLTQAAWKAAGVMLPRTAHEQATVGAAIALADLQPGDLVLFHDTVSHVGICTGNGMMIHAPGPGAFIREESIFYAGKSAIHGAVRPA